MRWKTGRRSSNVEDRRGGGIGDGSMTGGRRKMGVGRRTGIGGGLGTIILVLVAMYFGVDLTSMLQVGGQMDGGGIANIAEMIYGSTINVCEHPKGS